MAAKSPTNFSMLFLLVACVASMGVALLAPPPAASPLPILPHGSWESGLPRTRTFPSWHGWKGLRQCWSPLENVTGCINQIYDALSNAQFDRVGPACCQAIIHLKKTCWTPVFDYSTFFPALLRNYCAQFSHASTLDSLTPSPDITDNNISTESKILVLPQPKDVELCWSSLAKVPNCVTQIFNSLSRGRIRALEPACCRAINAMSHNCWSVLFPFDPFFPPVLRNSCTSGKLGTSSLVSLPRGNEIVACWSRIQSVGGCVEEIYGSLSTGRVDGVGPDCCKAVTETVDDCWAMLFPFTPSFPASLKSFCTAHPPSPKST